MSDQSIYKRFKTYICDVFGWSASPPSFDIGQLPLELQEMIIVKAAVAHRLSSETFGDVFEVLAPVCKLWLDLMKTPVLYKTIKQETYLRDPMCRYLQKAQSIRVVGVIGKSIYSAVTLGDRLYVVDFLRCTKVSRIFVYDLDTSAVRNEKPWKRILACTNREPLVVLGLNASYGVTQLVPCPHTNTLYVLEVDLHNDESWAVLRVKPDGTVLLRWDSSSLALPVTSVPSMSLSLSGAYMIMTTDDPDMDSVTVLVCSTSTGAFVNMLDTTVDDGSNLSTNGDFLTSILPDDCLVDLAKLSSSKRYVDYNLALDDRMLLLLSDDGLVLVDTHTDRRRLLPIARLTKRRILAPETWYDKERGLLFSPRCSGLSVLRITY